MLCASHSRFDTMAHIVAVYLKQKGGVTFGTIIAHDYDELREVIQEMAEGKTLEEACKKCVEAGTSLYNIPLGDGGN